MGRMLYWQNNGGGKDLFLAFYAGAKVFFEYEWVQGKGGDGEDWSQLKLEHPAEVVAILKTHVESREWSCSKQMSVTEAD